MRYYLDFEFIEDFTKPFLGIFGRRRHYIEMISVGLVAEDGRKYYAVSKEFDLKEVWNKYQLKSMTNLGGIGDTPTQKKEYWLRDNVLAPIYNELATFHLKGQVHPHFGFPKSDTRLMKFDYKTLKWLIATYGKSTEQIAREIKYFVNPEVVQQSLAGLWPDKAELALHNCNHNGFAQPEFYGYYADYDWVLLCSLYGRMIDLPNGYPYYCRDLQQMSDELYAKKKAQHSEKQKNSLTRIAFLNSLSNHPDYPRQTNEHNALADAEWNKYLHEFIEKVKDQPV